MVDPLINHSVLIPGPSFHGDLSALDALHPVHYSRRLLIFRCASAAQALETTRGARPQPGLPDASSYLHAVQLAALKHGLQSLVSQCPVLGGKIVPLEPDAAKDGKEDWRTVVPDQGIELIVRDLRDEIAPFEDLEKAGFPLFQLPYDLLVPVPEDLGKDRPFAACKVQFSAINGGSIMTFAMSHSVGDGSANNEMMRVLSEAIRTAHEDPSESVTDNAPPLAANTGMGLDRSVLRNIKSELQFHIEDHPAYRLKASTPASVPLAERHFWPPDQSNLTGEASIHPFEATSPEVPVLLHISAADLAQLKKDATSPNGPPISTHDALTALMWRTVILIRSQRSSSAQNLPPATPVSFFMPSDARRHLNLPPSYIGNAVYQLMAELDLGTLLSASGLQHAASAIRRAITAVTPALVASYMTALKEEWIDWGFMESYSTTGVAMGTDWSSAPYDDDWGQDFGRVVRYRYPGEPTTCVLPKLPDGSAEVVVSVMPQEMDVLKGSEGFGKYLAVE